MQSQLGSCNSLTLALHPLTTHIVLTVHKAYPHSQAAVLGKGGPRQDPSQDGGALPIPTNAGDQTKNQVILHVESPTKPYRILCPPCESAWCVWLGQGSAYQALPYHQSGCAAVLL